MYTKDESIKELKKMLKPYDRVYTILRHVSASGMSRHIGVLAMEKGEPRDITWHVANVLEYKRNKYGNGLVVGGCGMDMGFHVIYELGRVLYPKGFKVRERGRNGDTSGWDNDGGYALGQEWI